MDPFKLPGKLCFAQHLPMDHEHVVVELRREDVRKSESPTGMIFAIYLDGKLVDRVAGTAADGYRRCDEITGLDLGAERAKYSDLESSMGG